MDIIFVAHWNEEKNNNIGVKLQGEISGFEQLGHTVTSIRFKNSGVWAVTGKAWRKLFDVSDSGFAHLRAIPKAVDLLLKQQGTRYQLCYVRHTFCTPWHLAMLKKLKRNNVFTVEEIPTYPYDAENKFYKGKAYKAAAQVDRVCRNFYKHWLDRIATFSKDKMIFGVQTVCIENGIDLAATPWTEHRYPRGGQIDLVAVSSMKPWHGYERLITGLAEYKHEQPRAAARFTIHMIGDGEMRATWQALADRLGIAEQVIFYGNRTGQALTEIMDKCSIAIAGLADYKHAGTQLVSSALKNREYLARGIPFVYALADSLPLEERFCLKIPNCMDPVDLSQIEAFYDRLGDEQGVSRKMRTLAQARLSWAEQMKKIVDAASQKGEESRNVFCNEGTLRCAE